MSARQTAFRNLQVCADCGGACRNRDYHDADNRDNVAGVPACTCRSRRPAPSAEDH